MKKSTVVLSLTEILLNEHGYHDGDITPYVQNLFNFHNVDLPYHNLRHMLDVTWKAYHGGIVSGLPPRVMRNLIIAAIYHDANHPGQLNGMDKNSVARAIETLNRHILPEDENERHNIVRLIQATEYPHAKKGATEGYQIDEAVLQDADMSMVFSDVWLQQILVGISKEEKSSIKLVLFAQPAFIGGKLNFTSVWGKDEFEHLKEGKINEMLRWIKILGLEKEYREYHNI
ncbi:MAG: hypothetical protein JWM20_521 [Patescibacteria group bacterium]|nr:hypothetical protein [Patescibacteria group bacterium]